MKKTLILITLLMFSLAFADAPLGAPKLSERPVFQKGKVKFQLTEIAFKSGMLNVDNRSKSYSQTGFVSIDKLNEKYSAIDLKRVIKESKNQALENKLGLDRWYMVDIPEDLDVMSVVEEYKKDPNVEFANPEYYVYRQAVPNDPYHVSHNWGHNNTAQMLQWQTGDVENHTGSPVGAVGFDANAHAGWDGSQGYGSSTVTIGIMDSGIDTGHEDLNDTGGYDFGDGDNNPMDDSGNPGHGTSCAGVAAGIADNGKGVAGAAGGCRLMGLKIADSSGGMSFTSMENALIYAADQGLEVISMSFGAYLDPGDSPSTDSAVEYAYNADCVMLAATSNDGYSYTSYPANHSYVIAVGASAPDGGRKTTSSIDGEYWWASNYGSTTQDGADAVDFLAPTILPTTDISGNAGYQSGDYYLYFNGTSCATPYAAGFAALIKSKYPTYTNVQVRALMRSTCIDVEGGGWDRYSGYGEIDIQAALNPGGTPPGVPTLISPTDGSSLADLTPTFDWDDVVDADSYTILVDNASNFSSPEINENPTSSEYTPSADLAEGIYYWKVLATNASGSSSYSGVWDVTLITPLPMPGIPTLITPTNGSTVEDLTPTFDWSDASDAAGYHIQISTNKQMSAIIIDTTTPTSDYTPPSDMAEDVYYWWVSSTNATGESSFTGYWDVNVIAPPPLPGISTLISPADASDTFDLTPSFDWSDASDATGYEILVDNNSDFSSPEINTTTTSSDYTAVSDLAFDTYYWKVRATNGVGNGDYSSTWSFNVLISPPSVPTLISPADVSTIEDTTPAFDWSDASGATGYEILVDNNSDFSSPEINTSTVNSEYTPGTDLALDTYYWKVLATNSSGNSSYSGTWSFTLQAPLPGVPTLIEPSDLAGVQDTTPYFDWSDASDAVSYEILVDNNLDFSSPEINTSSTPSEYTAVSALALDTYYWKVRSVNATGNSNYSGVWSFDVQAPMPDVPVLITPTDGSTVEDLTPAFDWNDAANATGYHIQISTNKQMTAIIIDTTTPTSDYTPPSDLAEDVYYWWVSSTNVTGESSFTAYWIVTVVAPLPLPGDVTLISPADASDTFDLTPAFDWSDATGATGYEILVDNNADFSSPEINTTTVNSDYTAGTDLALDTYYWKVRATNGVGNGNYSGTWSFNILISPPSAPTLISPSDASTIEDTTPAFDWSDAPDATGYQILVDNNSDFSSPEINTTTVNSDYTAVTDLVLDTYYWKVLASNTSGDSPHSSTWSFILQVPLPGVPTLITPADVSTTQDQTPYFDWSDASDATGYEILVDNNSDFSSPEINTTSVSSEYTAPSDLAFDIYYWKVRSTNTTGNSNYTVSWSFTIESSLPLPGIPTLIAPTDVSTTQDQTPYFDWSDASDAATYDVLVDNNSDFSSPEIDTSVSVSEYTAPSDLALGTYYWKVRSVNATGNSNYSGTWSFAIQAPLPGIPTLITPTDGSTVEDLTPTFDWSDVVDATGYHIQVATRSNMTDLVVDIDVALSEFTSGTDMAEDVYYWRVLATNATGSSSYTGIWDVNVIAPPPLPGIATLLSPSDASDVYDLTPSFDWSDASDATGYEILVDNNADFSSPEVNTTTVTSDYLAVSDLALDTYYWKVRATNAVGNGEYSSTWSFTVLPLSTPINVVTSISGVDLVIDWDVVAGATGYDVYSSDDPYGTFTLAASVGTNQYTVAADQAKLFYYIVATNATK